MKLIEHVQLVALQGLLSSELHLHHSALTELLGGEASIGHSPAGFPLASVWASLRATPAQTLFGEPARLVPDDAFGNFFTIRFEGSEHAINQVVCPSWALVQYETIDSINSINSEVINGLERRTCHDADDDRHAQLRVGAGIMSFARSSHLLS